MGEARKWQLEVVKVRHAGEDYAWVHVAAPREWRSAPGQFLNILARGGNEEIPQRTLAYDEKGAWPRASGKEVSGVTPLVRRPVSISYVSERGDGCEVVLLVRAVGAGSRWIGARKSGDVLDVLGPLGKGFDLSLASARAFLVGGGCGVAPLVGAARELLAGGKDVTVFYGCGQASHVPISLPEGMTATGRSASVTAAAGELSGAKLVVATEDGSLGYKGLVTEAMRAHAERSGASSGDGWEDVSILACGPDAMMAAVAELAREHKVKRCQVSLENYMGCAIGVCLSCAVKVRAANERGWTYKLACSDGPVFESSEVIFEGKWEGCKR